MKRQSNRLVIYHPLRCFACGDKADFHAQSLDRYYCANCALEVYLIMLNNLSYPSMTERHAKISAFYGFRMINREGAYI